MKKLLAEAMLDIAILKDVASKNGDARCEAGCGGSGLCVHGVSQRRACEVLAVDRLSIRYKSVRPDDAAERAAMKAVAAERRRFGYRRIHIMLDRQGIVMNLKKLRRLYLAKRSCRFASAAVANGRWEHGDRWFCRRRRMNVEPRLHQRCLH